MSRPSAQKVLRVGIFQGDRCLEERLLRKRGPITIGQTLSNTFVVPTSSMPTSYKLLDVAPDGGYTLYVNDRMGGRLSLGGSEVVDLTRLRNVSAAKRTADGYQLTLSRKARGKVTIGETRILFQFVTPPAANIGMLPTALGGGALAGFSTFLGAAILATVAFSAVVHIAPLFFIMLKDWPEPEGYQEIPDWYLEQEAEAIEEDEEEDTEEEDTDEEGENDKKETEVAEDVDLEPEPDKPKETKKEARTLATPEEKRIRKERGKKMIGKVFGVEGGDASIGASIAGDIIGSEAPISALEGLTASDIGGAGGAGTAGLGLGGAGSATGEPSLKDVEGGSGSEKLIGSGGQSAKPAERRKVKLKIKEDTKIPTSVEQGDKKGIESVFKKKGKQIENCYKRVIMKYGDQPGKLVVKITIGGDGSVLSVKTSVDEIGKGLSACVEAKIKRWKFPKIGKPITVAKRWVFG